MLTVNIITLFPELFTEHFKFLPVKRALDKKLLSINLIQLRDFANDKRGTVDDSPYGGGVGMILQPEPIFKALSSLGRQDLSVLEPSQKIICLTPRGQTYNQRLAESYAKCTELTFICGRYEGIDARIEDFYCTDRVSIGNYVLSGGELPVLSILESVTRLLPGVLEKEDAAKIESFSEALGGGTEFKQYTRPADFNGHAVPEVLLGGNHGEIEKWRKGTVND